MSYEPDYEADRRAAIEWAQAVLSDSDTVILDTETTGLGPGAEVVQVSVIDALGNVLLDTLVKPCDPIPPEAIEIHDITNERVATAPAFPEIYPRLLETLKGKYVVIYNASFDIRILNQSLHRHGLSLPTIPIFLYTCAMDWYAPFYGEWNHRRGSYRWQRLTGGDHSALGDCHATLALLYRMAEAGK